MHKVSGYFHKKQLFNLAIIWSVCTILALTSAYQNFIYAGPQNTNSFWTFLLGTCLLWYYWALVTPIILWVSKRAPFNKKKAILSVCIHLITWAILSVPKILIAFFVYTRIFKFILPDSITEHFKHYIGANTELELITYVCILGASMAFAYQKKLVEREVYSLQLQMQLSAAELNALKLQLQPHFLFNTLNAAAMLIRFSENKKAIEVISGLSELLRRTLEQTGKQTVTLKEELELTDYYIQIEKVRFQDQITIEINIAANTLEAVVPNLLLQPLVENAIKHGVSKRESGGKIEIKSWKEDDTLKLQISDNGANNLPELNQGNGIGLANTRERLHHLYGEAHSIEISQIDGFIILMTIPYIISS